MPDPVPGAVVLDTHVWLWLMEGERGVLSAGAVEEIEAAGRRGELLVPAISLWEVAMLEAKRRISLSRPVEDWVRSALRTAGTHLLPLTPEIAIESTRLPGPMRGDPSDRIVIASARVAGARLATRDRGILDYATGGHLAVLDVTP